jgi:hypothetical protein
MAENVFELFRQVEDEIAAHLGGTDAALAQRALQLNEGRAQRLAATRDRLARELGADHPRVAELSERHAFVTGLNRELAAFVDRQRRPTTLKAREWQLHGRVVDGVGRALVGAKVRPVGREHELPELIEPAITNDRGEFSAVYHMKDLAPDGPPPHLAIVVEDAKGKQLLHSEETVQPAARQSDYVEIVLSKLRATPRDRCQALTTKGAPCRNPAEPGFRFCAVHRRQP